MTTFSILPKMVQSWQHSKCIEEKLSHDTEWTIRASKFHSPYAPMLRWDKFTQGKEKRIKSLLYFWVKERKFQKKKKKNLRTAKKNDCIRYFKCAFCKWICRNQRKYREKKQCQLWQNLRLRE